MTTPVTNRETTTTRRRLPRWQRDLILGIVVASGIPLWLFVHSTAGLFFNGTVSLPTGYYQLRDAPIEVGAIVVACLREEASALALVRGYLGEGNCPTGTAPVGKALAAVAGDTVTVTERGIWIRGRLLPQSAPLTRDSEGFPLPDIRGRYVLQPGEAWLYSGYNERSFDSRYYGPIDVAGIRGVIVPLWIWTEPYDPRADLGAFSVVRGGASGHGSQDDDRQEPSSEVHPHSAPGSALARCSPPF